MWLINTTTLRLKTFPDEREIDYAILSHRWEEDEVLFEHLSAEQDRRAQASQMRGFRKIAMCCDQAKRDGHAYAWVDTCCIDKSSSAELQEAINSMYRWYSKAAVCYAYLTDVVGLDPDHFQFRASQWFKRGWTLQELIAPSKVKFYGHNWALLGTRAEFSLVIGSITGIPVPVLETGLGVETRPSTAEIMSWARGRRTTRVEDRAYSLMGLFDINMPMLYGEGDKAFKRLQEEIIRTTHDQSIFAWEGIEDGNPGVLARSPDNFPPLLSETYSAFVERVKPHTITNEGISLTVELRPWVPRIYLAVLNCTYHRISPFNVQWVGIFLHKVDEEGRYARVRCHNRELWRSSSESYNAALDSDNGKVSVNVIRALISPLERRIVSAPLPFYGFQVVLCTNRPTTADIFRTALATFEESTQRLGLTDGVSGVAGEIILKPPTLSSLPIRIKLAFYHNFVPHCVVHRSPSFKSKAGWYVGDTGWRWAQSDWQECARYHPDTCSVAILQGRREDRSFDIGGHFSPGPNIIVLHPAPNRYNLDSELRVSRYPLTIIDSIITVTDWRRRTIQQIRIEVSAPEPYEVSVPWIVRIHPDWVASAKEEELRAGRRLVFRGEEEPTFPLFSRPIV